jgi:farnesyl diphosphate synthase
VSNAGVALNDASFVETGIYQLLKMHFKDKPYYVDVLELFHDVSNVSLTMIVLYSTHNNHHLTKNAFCNIRLKYR